MKNAKSSSQGALFGPLTTGCPHWVAIEIPVADTRKTSDPDPQKTPASAEDHRAPGDLEHTQHKV